MHTSVQMCTHTEISPEKPKIGVYIQMSIKCQVTQEESLNDSEKKSNHKFQLKVKNPEAEECLKPKLLLIRLHKFHFVFFHFSYLL